MSPNIKNTFASAALSCVSTALMLGGSIGLMRQGVDLKPEYIFAATMVPPLTLPFILKNTFQAQARSLIPAIFLSINATFLCIEEAGKYVMGPAEAIVAQEVSPHSPKR